MAETGTGQMESSSMIKPGVTVAYKFDAQKKGTVMNFPPRRVGGRTKWLISWDMGTTEMVYDQFLVVKGVARAD